MIASLRIQAYLQRLGGQVDAGEAAQPAATFSHGADDVLAVAAPQVQQRQWRGAIAEALQRVCQAHVQDLVLQIVVLRVVASAPSVIGSVEEAQRFKGLTIMCSGACAALCAAGVQCADTSAACHARQQIADSPRGSSDKPA